MREEEQPSTKNIKNLNYTNMSKKKALKITIEETDNISSVIFNAKGLTDFEIVGLLSYYLDSYKVKMLQENGSNKQQKDE